MSKEKSVVEEFNGLMTDVMNLPCRFRDHEFASQSDRANYKVGHSDACHDAVNLISEFAGRCRALGGNTSDNSSFLDANKAAEERGMPELETVELVDLLSGYEMASGDIQARVMHRKSIIEYFVSRLGASHQANQYPKEDGYYRRNDSGVWEKVEVKLAQKDSSEKELGLVACIECGGTGEADSGGVHPWGDPAMITCGCRGRAS